VWGWVQLGVLGGGVLTPWVAPSISLSQAPHPSAVKRRSGNLSR
jgi:hypothetical protein